MNSAKKIILIPILIVIFTFSFTFLEIGLEIHKITQIIQPFIFALSAVLCILYNSLRRLILKISLVLLALMVLTYLFDNLDFANWIGSLGFGMLVIVIFSYLPILIKKGYIENL